MAAGVPLVVSDWNGYRDLVRNGIDGFRVPTRWASVAQQASVPLGWQQLLGLEPYPKVAGALGQLVQVDTQAAEAALLTLLARAELRRAMGLLLVRGLSGFLQSDRVAGRGVVPGSSGTSAAVNITIPLVLNRLVSTFSCYATNAEALPIHYSLLRSKRLIPSSCFSGRVVDLLRWSLPEGTRSVVG